MTRHYTTLPYATLHYMTCHDITCAHVSCRWYLLYTRKWNMARMHHNIIWMLQSSKTLSALSAFASKIDLYCLYYHLSCPAHPPSADRALLRRSWAYQRLLTPYGAAKMEPGKSKLVKFTRHVKKSKSGWAPLPIAMDRIYRPNSGDISQP